MRAAKNVIGAMANSAVNVLIALVAMPIYLRFLGMEAYGLIGFFVTVQAMAQVLDLGLAATMSREAARAKAGARPAQDLFRTMEVIYAGVGALIALSVCIAAPAIAASWLQSKTIPMEAVATAVTLIGLNLACRWPISLYHNALAGSDRLATSSVISICVNFAAAVISVLVLALVSKSIQAFFVVQVAFGFSHVLVIRAFAKRELAPQGGRFDLREIVGIWRFSAGVGAIALTSLAFTQLDKALLSSVLDLEEFGAYMLAVLVVGGLQIFVSPAFSYIYPKFSALAASGNWSELSRVYSLGTRLLGSLLFPAAFTLAIYSEDLASAWTGNASIGSKVGPVIAILTVGSALNGIMHFPYALQLASGNTRLPLGINLFLLALLAPLTVFLALHHGPVGGALSWAIVGVVYVILGTIATGYCVRQWAGLGWLLRDVSVPFFVSALVVGVVALAALGLGLNLPERIACAALGAALAALASVTVLASSRRAVSDVIRPRYQAWLSARHLMA